MLTTTSLKANLVYQYPSCIRISRFCYHPLNQFTVLVLTPITLLAYLSPIVMNLRCSLLLMLTPITLLAYTFSCWRLITQFCYHPLNQFTVSVLLPITLLAYTLPCWCLIPLSYFISIHRAGADSYNIASNPQTHSFLSLTPWRM